MGYEEAMEASQEDSWKFIFRGQIYLPFKKPIDKVIVAPTDKKRSDQFWELYVLYHENWQRAAAHFQMEDFASLIIFRTEDGPKAVAFTEFTRLNRIHINMHEVDDDDL